MMCGENRNKSQMITTSFVVRHVIALFQICCWNYHTCSIGHVQAFVPYDHNRISSAIISKVDVPICQRGSIKNNAEYFTSRSSLDSFRLQSFWKIAHRLNGNSRNNIILYMSSSSSSSQQAAEQQRQQHYSRSTNIDLIQGMTTIDQTIDILHSKLSHLCESSLYFRLYSVDILGSCEYMSQELAECYAERCEIYPEDDDMIPPKLITLDQQDGNEIYELDSWSRWDMPSNDYYDTQTFTEGYTGYDGSSVWKKIHETIAFPTSSSNDSTNNWKNDFNKIISGLHSLISAQVTRGIQEKIENGEEFGIDDIWTDPTNEYRRRLSPYGETPLALENLYYTCMVLISAINTVKDTYIVEYNSRHIDDNTNLLNDILSMSLFTDTSVNVPAMTIQQHTTANTYNNNINNDLWQARMRSRDLLRIMNCVQCNKCRFHGKISTMGVITAMKIIIGSNNTKLTRVELSTLLTTLYKCTSAIQFCKEMEQQIA